MIIFRQTIKLSNTAVHVAFQDKDKRERGTGDKRYGRREKGEKRSREADVLT